MFQIKYYKIKKIKGNMIYHNNNDNQRHFCWTEDNRLQGFMDNRNTAFYNYDASGERNMKITGHTLQTTQNGEPVYYPFLENPVLYTNGLITINEHGYTKHYFTEGNRVCSKIGGGFANAPANPLATQVAPMEMAYNEQKSFQEDGIMRTFVECIDKEAAFNFFNKISNSVQNSLNLNDPEPAFYYLTDHLGSSSYITDGQGNVTQTISYLPFGEEQVDLVHFNPAYETPYKFNGKEKDEETGFNYFGARYYYDYLSIWLSVDPLMHKYPHLSPYVYCLNNPVRVTDPDGRDVEITRNDEDKKVTVRANFYYSKKDIERKEGFSVAGAMQQSLDSWGTDIKTAVNETEGMSNYSVDVQFNMIDVDKLDNGMTAKEMADGDRIGNAIIHDETLESRIQATVGNNKYLRVNMNNAASDDGVYFGTTTLQGTIKHEIGHFFGLWDRAGGNGHAPYIKNDLMSYDVNTRGNAVAPFKRVLDFTGLKQAGTKSILINKNKREPK
ncbi:MAG: RHS repeat-associated core domain-containing protein [Bacteroidales bacterium]|jgi:RHS repeat-associated protein|nr:RHS repeat-associated core domain-containing protein [Bacteroidales bacterium]